MKHHFHVAASALLSALFLSSPVIVFGQTSTSDTDESDTTIEKIVVVGTQTKLESARHEAEITPGGVEIIDMDDFRKRNVSSMADVLRYVPGIWTTSDSGNDKIFFSSRGSNLDATDYDMNGIKLLKDGLPITSADGNNHNRVVDPLSAQHATVARGANALKYGASTLGGAIDFVSVTAKTSDLVDLSLNGGSFGQQRGRITVSDEFNDTFDGLLTIENKHWDGYRDHNNQDRKGVYGNSGWQISDAVATRFYGTWLENDQEFPGSLSQTQVEEDPDQANAAAAASGGHYQLNVDTWRLANKTSWQIDNNRRLDIGFSIEEQSLYHPIVDRVLVDFDGPGPGAPVEVFSLLVDTDQRNLGAVVRYDQRLGAHDLLLGANYGDGSDDGGNYRNLHGLRNGLTTVIDNEATLLEVFAMDRWQINDQLMLVLAAQSVTASRDVRNTDVDSGTLSNPSDDYSSVNPRIGMIYDLGDDMKLYANVSRVYEPPTNYQLQDNVAGGDATLDAMKGTVVELGSRGNRDFGTANHLLWDVALYYAQIDNEILSVDDPAAPGTSLSTNIDDTTHAGLEAVVSASFALDGNGDRTLEPVVSLSVNDFTFDNDINYGDNRLPAAPNYVVRGELMYRDSSGFYFGPTVDVVGDRYADFVNSYKVDGYTLLGLRGGWSGDRWSVYADIHNGLDEDYIANHLIRNIAAPDEQILNPGAPLSAYLGVRWQFE